MNDRLRLAMNRADIPELEIEAERIGQEAVSAALVVTDDGQRLVADGASRAKAEAEAQRQRDLDAAMADTVTIVERMRQRLGRRPWSSSDGATVNRIFGQLKAMNGDAPDSGFGS